MGLRKEAKRLFAAIGGVSLLWFALQAKTLWFGLLMLFQGMEMAGLGDPLSNNTIAVALGSTAIAVFMIIYLGRALGFRVKNGGVRR